MDRVLLHSISQSWMHPGNIWKVLKKKKPPRACLKHQNGAGGWVGGVFNSTGGPSEQPRLRILSPFPPRWRKQFRLGCLEGLHTDWR